MCHHGHAGSQADFCGLRRVDRFDRRPECSRAIADRREQLVIALLTVGFECLGMGRAIGDGAAMGWVVEPIGERDDLVERGKVICHGAIGDRDESGIPAHDVIAGEENICAGQAEGEVIGAVAGGGVDGERHVAGYDVFTVDEDAIRNQIPIA